MVLQNGSCFTSTFVLNSSRFAVGDSHQRSILQLPIDIRERSPRADISNILGLVFHVLTSPGIS